jgi:hypothetical protein
MCGVAVKRRLATGTSIFSATSRSVLSTNCSEGLVRHRENAALPKRFVRFMQRRDASAPSCTVEKFWI